MIAAFKSFKHGTFKILCLNFQDAFVKTNQMLTASDYNVFSFGSIFQLQDQLEIILIFMNRKLF